MTNEELLAALSQRFDQIDKRFYKIQNKLDDIEQRLGDVEERLGGIEERLGGVEEDSEITRDGVNALLDWADIIGRINKHPIAK